MLRARRHRGFTLTEVAIVLGIVAMVTGVTISALSSTSIAEVRATSRRLASMSRSAYEQSVLTGQIHRLAIDLGSKTKAASVTLQSTPELLRFADNEPVIARVKPGGGLGGWQSLAQGFMFGGDEDGEEGPGLDGFLPGGIDELLGLMPSELESPDDFDDESGMKADGFETVGKPVVIDTDLAIFDVWVEGMDDPQTEGVAYLYFFPHGYTQKAYIHIGVAETGEGGYTLELEPLTGRPVVHEEYVEPER